VVQRYNKYLKSYSISAIFFVFILRNEGRWKKADGRRLMEDGRRLMADGRRKRAEGRGLKEEGRNLVHVEFFTGTCIRKFWYTYP
jgi:hypothetical protein